MRGSITREVIVQGALVILETEGMEKLSMRRLGRELGVKAMSLYNHVSNKADLLNAIHAQLLGELTQPTDGLEWEDAIRGVATDFRDLLARHPQTIPLFATRSAIAPESLNFLDACIGSLRKAGFETQTALQVFQILFSFVLGHAQFYFSERSEDSLSRMQDYENYEHLSKVSSVCPKHVQAEFETAIESLIRGFRDLL